MMPSFITIFFLSVIILFSSYFSLSADDFDDTFGSHSTSLELRERGYVNVIELKETYPELERIDLNAIRDKRVDLLLKGKFPVLKEIVYQGSFGLLTGSFSGEFPSLQEVSIATGPMEMRLDFRGTWKKNCVIHLSNRDLPIKIVCPKNVGVIVHTKGSKKGKVLISSEFQRCRTGGFRGKTFKNKLVDTSPILLVFHIRSDRSEAISLS